VNAGAYILNPELIARIPREGECPMTWVIQDALARDELLGAYQFIDHWTDVGRVSDLAHAMGNGG